MAPIQPLIDRYHHVQERISDAANRVGRDLDSVTLVAVTKTVSVGPINEMIRAGIRNLGENRVQEALEKRSEIQSSPDGTPLVHHLIGGLQTNKARKAVQNFDLIQSVDRTRLAESLNRIAGEEGKIQRCLLEIKISEEATKTGLAPGEVSEFFGQLSNWPNLRFEGCMGIAPFDETEGVTRKSFQMLREFFEKFKGLFGPAPILSMGMTDDFEWAIQEGSTMVRVGRALFGERQK